MTPATFADFMDGLSRAMGLPVAPAAPAHRVTLPAAPAQAMLAADPDVRLDAVVAAMYEARVTFTERERAAVMEVNDLLSVYPRPTVDEACAQVAPRYDVKPNTLKEWRKSMLRAAREAHEEAA